ncbi:MAG: hypothetical protein R3A44_45055 [Caldilineaceae bacterium]
MARLNNGEKAQVTNRIYSLLRQHDMGLRESEIAEMTRMDRRRVNNYLRELEAEDKAYKEGWEWFVD